MKNGIFGKGLAFTLIILFIGMNSSSVIGGSALTKSLVQYIDGNAGITESHDVGVWKILKPAGPSAPWSPGEYTINSLITNNDFYNGFTFNVNAKIWEINSSGNESLYYEDNKVVYIPPYDWATVAFNNVTFYEPGPPIGGRGKNISYRLEVTTELTDDGDPTNNQKILNFTICYLETDFFDFKLYGTQENNGWYAPGAWLVIFYNASIIQALFFNIDDSGFILYKGPPIYIGEDGSHRFYVYVNNESVLGPFAFKTDGTPPQIYMTVSKLNLLGTKWLFNATVADETSGVAVVEFWVDDVLVGNATAFPYTFIYSGKGKVAQAIAYDFAGNYGLTSMVSMPLISSQSQSRSNLGLHNIFNYLFFHQFHHQMKGWNQ